ncbi:MAG: hypothetical protein ACI9TV_001980 [Sulfurimonas sp.]|jgi:hypothetical protein|uniref:flagellar assembly protein A n=1 Tax=Sulfurimonas sp. TaxID=2022749 RepID=UPI0039E24671
MSFELINVTSESISKSLIEFARNNKINPKQLDFELISFKTLLKREKDIELSILEDTDAITEDDIKNVNTTIFQEYTITIKPLVKKVPTINIALSANTLKTKTIVTIKQGSVFNKQTHTLEALKEHIWHKKLKVGFLIDLFEANLEKQLHKLLQIIPYDKALKKDLKFTLGIALDPTLPRDAKLERLYETKDKDSLVNGVQGGELIARYILPKNGVSGRNCHGKIIAPQNPKILAKKPTIEDSVEEKTFENFIEYFALINGYVVFQNSNLKISQTIKLQEANFKTSANIDTEDNTDISVRIAHAKSESEDAIGSGVAMDVKELNVDGSIAANVNIAAQNINIDAQTHKKSKMTVLETATIKLHRGDLTAKDAHIEILESGKVTATNSVSIGKMLGGIVIAPIVHIGEVLANTTIIASELIEIKSITGEHNKLIIDPDAIASYHNEIELLKKKIEEATKELKNKKSDLNTKIQEHSAKTDRIKTFQKRVVSATKSGKTPMKQDIIRVKQFKKDSDKLHLEKESLAKEESAITVLELERDKLCNKDLYAKIKSKTFYDGHTQVVFVDVKTKEEINFLPHGNIDIISLVLDADGKRVISTD